MSPGLHVFFTPLANTDKDTLCHQLHEYVNADLKCLSIKDASIRIPTLSERFSMSASSQYYAHLDSISEFVDKILTRICKPEYDACGLLGRQLSTAAYVDVDYDTITGTIVLTAVWAEAPDEAGWSETIRLPTIDSRVEIGVLSHEPNSDPEDIQFGGLVTVLGQDTAPSTSNLPFSA